MKKIKQSRVIESDSEVSYLLIREGFSEMVAFKLCPECDKEVLGSVPGRGNSRCEVAEMGGGLTV